MMTDEELDRDWKPSGRRPQSTIARSFSQELMDIFRIENSVADLDEKVDKRKHNVQSQATELEALEARIKEMEERLKRQSMPNYQPTGSPRTQRPPVSGAFGEPSSDDLPPKVPEKDSARRPASRRTQQQQQEQQEGSSKHGSRPGTARASQQAVPGALPPTPTASEGEYEFEFVDAPSDGDSRKKNVASKEKDKIHSHQHNQHPVPHIPLPQRRRPPRAEPQTTTMNTTTLLTPEDHPHQNPNTGSESESCADFVIVSGADGDGPRDS